MTAQAHKQQDEFLEAAFDFGHWLEKHWKALLRYIGIVLAVGVLVAAFFGWQRSQAAKARKDLAVGASAFEKAAVAQFTDFEALADALAAFEAAEARVGNSSPGPLATYYRGATLYRLGRKDEAIEALESFVAGATGDESLDWAGTALLATLLADGGNSARAVEVLEAVAGEGSSYPMDQVLVQLGRIHQDAGDETTARASWQRVVDEFAQSAYAREAQELLAD